MAFEYRARQRYYYKKVRVGDKVKSIYLGRGPEAHAEAERLAKRREQDRQWNKIEALITLLHTINETKLYNAGWYRPNRGPWRKRIASYET